MSPGPPAKGGKARTELMKKTMLAAAERFFGPVDVKSAADASSGRMGNE